MSVGAVQNNEIRISNLLGFDKEVVFNKNRQHIEDKSYTRHGHVVPARHIPSERGDSVIYT